MKSVYAGFIALWWSLPRLVQGVNAKTVCKIVQTITHKIK